MLKKQVYFVGIGGIGMSALARFYLKTGARVSGSDLSSSLITKELSEEGVKVFIGLHKKENLNEKTDLVIYTQAVGEDNEELVAARTLGIPTKSYPQAVGELTKSLRTIAIAGAHGKSTTTALLALIFIKAKLDPTVIVGTRLKEFKNSNFRFGAHSTRFARSGLKSENILILEADEWRASFLNYYPSVILITNIDREHLDFYKDLNEIKNTYLKFVSNIQNDGILVLNRDDKNVFSLKSKFEKITKAKNVKIIWYGIQNNDIASRYINTLKICGEHNLSNAVGAATLAEVFNINKKIIAKAFSSYRGSWRRMELRGRLNGAKIYDDYAHHPTEIRATLRGVREFIIKGSSSARLAHSDLGQTRDESRVWCVFQPHQEQRLRILFKDFVHAFDEADYLIILDTYEVAGREKSDVKVSANDLVKEIKKHKKYVTYLPYQEELRGFLSDKIQKNDIVIMMGAGSINQYTDLLIN